MAKPMRDLTMQRFGKLTAIAPMPRELWKTNKAEWLCGCDCGQAVVVRSRNLLEGKTKSCGCEPRGKQAKDLTGMTKGKLTVGSRVPREDQRGSSPDWHVSCECGNDLVLSTNQLQRVRENADCGCGDGRVGVPLGHKYSHPREKHGMAGTPEYVSWQSMKSRCLNPNTAKYPHYGGRGITIYEPWVESFEAFLAYMGPRPEGLSLDRIDPDGDYEPGNVRWADITTQNQNRRTKAVAA